MATKHTLIVKTVGNHIDASFAGADGKEIKCYEIPCVGSVDGVDGSFNCKIYGNESYTKIKEGLTMVGEKGEYQGNVFYSIKKANNPDMYAKSSYSGGGGYSKGGGYRANNELEALKLSVALINSAPPEVDSSEKLAELCLKIAVEKFLPFIKSSTKNHEEQKGNALNDKEIIGSIITEAGLGNALKAKGVRMAEITMAWNNSGKNKDTFVNLLKTSYCSVPEDDDDEIPF